MLKECSTQIDLYDFVILYIYACKNIDKFVCICVLDTIIKMTLKSNVERRGHTKR